ncbi:MAG: hypothetical protein JO063_07620 [Pseudonocardiales bacterium]|nr:hypothetical protein [Pseudonocardiales bacterium]MBV9029058.1 hypothetical protein [Pseudonocardiales bacterium]MBW0009973.1 hypothetical protein [Pseudonocardiales bacterium]
MIGSDGAESRAVVGAVRGAIDQARLDAGVNITGLLVDIECADDADFRRYFMCWHLTKVLGPSLTEMVPPAVVRAVACKETARPRIADPESGSGSARRSPATTLWRPTGHRWGIRREGVPTQRCQRGEDCFTVA